MVNWTVSVGYKLIAAGFSVFLAACFRKQDVQRVKCLQRSVWYGQFIFASRDAEFARPGPSNNLPLMPPFRLRTSSRPAQWPGGLVWTHAGRDPDSVKGHGGLALTCQTLRPGASIPSEHVCTGVAGQPNGTLVYAS